MLTLCSAKRPFSCCQVRKLPHCSPTLQTSSDQLGRAKACLLLHSSRIGASKAASRRKQSISIPTITTTSMASQFLTFNNLVHDASNHARRAILPKNTALDDGGKHDQARFQSNVSSLPTSQHSRSCQHGSRPGSHAPVESLSTCTEYTPKLACHQFVAWMHRQTPRCQSTSGRPQSASGIWKKSLSAW